MKKKFLLFADWNSQSGMGHLSRCLSLAQALNKNGVALIIVTDNPIPLNFLECRNIKSKIYNWYKVESLFKIAKKDTACIVDSYLAKPETYSYLYQNTKLLVSIDDNKRIDYPGGILINSNIYAKCLGYQQKNEIHLLLGSLYIPLKKVFWLRKNKVIRNKVNSILITTGGNDDENCIPPILHLLSEKFPRINKYILVTRNFSNLTEINKLSDQKTYVFQDAPAHKIRELMYQSDLAISGGGQTIYELANVGLPTIAIQQANNQKRNIQSWKKLGFIEYVGKASNPKTLNNINSAIIKLNSKRLRQQRCRIGRRLIDGRGAERVAEIIHEKTN